jgi:hypothetical protein
MKRRDFIKIITGSAAAWSIAAHAQQGDRVRHIGAITSLSSNDPEGQARYAAFLQELQVLGWSIGRNIQIEYFWGEGNRDRSRKNATELVALAPDVILATGSPTLQSADPVGAGYVNSLARPGGNAMGRLASPSRYLSDPRKRDITECDSWAEFALYSAARDKHSWTMTNAEGCQAVRGGACYWYH